MTDVYSHFREIHDFIDLVEDEAPKHASRYQIVPKKFTIENVSVFGRRYLSFEEGEQREFSGRSLTVSPPRHLRGDRVILLPYTVKTNSNDVERFIEIKGYGQDGRDICLWTHCDGDIMFGMFYKNAKKEYKILEKAFERGLHVPMPLFLGKISKDEWLFSGLRSFSEILRIPFKDLEKLTELDLETIRNELIKRSHRPYAEFVVPDPLSAFAQPYNAGVLGRASLSPFRIGDPSDNYELNQENINIARQCGRTFLQLLDMGYLHLSPGTGNWTEAGELTDMADCYDLKKDKNLQEIISLRESSWNEDFWENLIGPYHTSNLYPYFVQGLFWFQKLSLKEAAQQLKGIVSEKIQGKS